MPVENNLFLDVIIILTGAFLGGLGARTLRIPVILGYLGVGMVIGPHVLGVVANTETVRILAEFGVILLLFGVGIEVSFENLRQLGKVVVVGGILQVAGTIGFGFLVGLLLGWPPQQAILFGLVISLSSTMVVLKSLSDRGELGSLHGHILTGILLIQDLAFIPMVAILPALSGDGGPFLRELGLGILKATVVLGLMAVLGARAIPWLLNHVARLGSREVFVLAVIAITFATAGVTHTAGLSAAMGAFMAGLLLSKSDFGHRALLEIVPLRDTWSALFFVSLGMLIDLGFVAGHIPLVLIMIGATVVIKFVITTVCLRSFGYLPHTALLTGFGLVQIGEFSFILAGSAVAIGVVGQDFFSLTVASAVLTMALTPWTIAGGSRITAALSRRIPFLHPYRLGDGKPEETQPDLRGHAVICGLGRVGSLVAQMLEKHQVPLIAIDVDPNVIAKCQDLGRHAIHGASESQTVLQAASIESARLMVITTGDSISSQVTAQHALEMNPELDIVARVHWHEEGERMRELGVQEVVWPEMEAGLEILRHSLHHYGTPGSEVDLLVNRLREDLSAGSRFAQGEDLVTGGPDSGFQPDEPTGNED